MTKFICRYTKDDENGTPQWHTSDPVDCYGSTEAKQWLHDQEPEAYNIRVRVA